MTGEPPEDAGFRATIGGDNRGNVVNVSAGGTTGDIVGTIIDIHLPPQDGPLCAMHQRVPPGAPFPASRRRARDQPYADIVAQALAGVRAAERPARRSTACRSATSRSRRSNCC